jgi:putative ABC transport system substrate-binding protein
MDKRLEIFGEVVPNATRVAILWDVFSSAQLKAAETAARGLHLSLLPVELGKPPYDYERALQLAVRRGGRALFVPSSPLVYRDRVRIADAALNNRLPTIFAHREHVEAGGFIAYGPNMSDMFRTAAVYVAAF